MLLCKSKLPPLEKGEIIELLLAKGARIQETALNEILGTFLLAVEGRDRILSSVLRSMTGK